MSTQRAEIFMDIREKIGARITQSRKALGITIKELSERIGTLTAARICNWENGTRSPGPVEAKLLAVALDVAPSYLLCLSDDVHGDFQLSKVNLPRYIPIVPLTETSKTKKEWGHIIKNITAFSEGQPKVSLELKSKESTAKYLVATYIVDSSMSPKFSPNDVIIIDCEQKPRPGDFILVQIADTQLIAIRKYKESDKHSSQNCNYDLIALNSDWGTIHITDKREATILGTVIEHRAYFS